VAVKENIAAVWATPYTKTGPERRAAMVAAVQRIDAKGIKGDIVECGVWRGGNIIIARKLSPRRVCWLYDTFTGMTEPGPVDISRKGVSALERFHAGWCEASIGKVEESLRETGVWNPDYLRFIEGKVEETLLVPENLPGKIALLRLDTDWYTSTKAELEILYPRLARGGVLIVDDYGHWQGARKAVDEYFGKVRLTKIDYTAVSLVKP
jgi:hypothetical protein